MLPTNVNRGAARHPSPTNTGGKKQQQGLPTKGRAASGSRASPTRTAGGHLDTMGASGGSQQRRTLPEREYADPKSLLDAAMKGKVHVFERLRAMDPLLTNGFEHIRDYAGRTILHIAAWYGQTAVLDTLLRVTNSASPLLNMASLTTKTGNTVLHTAVQGGHAGTVEWLMLHPGLQQLISSRNARGLLPIDCAMQAGFGDVVAVFQGRR